MTLVFPLRFRRLRDENLVFANEAGQFFKAEDSFLNRLVSSELTADESDFLLDRSMASKYDGDINETAFLHRLSSRLKKPKSPSYLILVPTLRCDLACSYCQVSRAAINAKGFDWDEPTLNSVLAYLSELETDSIQIEFQGGEPTLRLDLMQAVMEFCRGKFSETRFIICTNLSNVSEDLLNLFSGDDVYVSTSMDGDVGTHQQQRTANVATTSRFFENFEKVQNLIGDRLSALPTLDTTNLPDPKEFLDAFAAYDMRSIYLRPVVYHGFARKRHPKSRNYQQEWQKFYEASVYEMVERNSELESHFYEEYYLTLILKRLLRPGEDSHVDLRSPNWLGYDHQLIDYDGQIYPSDEARMMARIKQVDLSIGHITTGIDDEKRRAVQGKAFNALDPWCSQCPYQAACGSDPIDDLARHGRADIAKPNTSFCQKHLHMFDFAMELIYSDDAKVQRSLAHWLGLPGPVKLGDSLL